MLACVHACACVRARVRASERGGVEVRLLPVGFISESPNYLRS